MRRFIILPLLLAGLAAAGCKAGARFATDGHARAGVGWQDGPFVDAKIPSVDVGADAGAVPGAVPFAGGTQSEPQAVPQPDPEVLKHLDELEAKLKESEAKGETSKEEADKLRAELQSLRDEERAPEAPPPKPIVTTVVEKAPGFIAKIVSGDVLGAIMGPEGIIGTVLSLWLGKKAFGKANAARKKRKERIQAIDAKLGVGAKPSG